MLEFILSKVQNVEQMINIKAVETADKRSDKSQFKYEVHDFTPLQLAIVAKQNNFKIVKHFLDRGAHTHMKVSSNQDTMLHLAAKHCKEFKILDYLVKNLKIDPFERNTDGDTVLTICQAKGNQKGVELIQSMSDLFDDSSKKTDELLAELLGEEEKNDKAKQKKKEKKHRSRLQKLA